ncbi:hypothetical protein FA15DRAFT_622500 [Coprinopsis marcescibilis]|uniref:Uncharacterized protein n=1 Tax=Coprinopsis marcescibilis TaxID=230819 RepID=A0A5C3KPH0_COPMA|nr:hypothetical protein FA15DRAFT_622500 [Coprinopsis marcescibilis]
MASKGSPYQSHQAPPGKQNMVDFSKALAGEMRILLDEVGKLRDEKRKLQFEIDELMTLKSKYSGEFGGGWRPAMHGPPPPMALEAPMPPPPMEDIGPARPGWRTVPKKMERRKKIAAPPPPPPQPLAAIALPPQPMFEPPPNVPAWAQWRPNPLLAVPTAHSPPIPTPPPRGGLFGASTPPPGR